MCLVEEEDELGLVTIAHLGQRLEQLAEHPQQEHRVDLRAIDEARRIEHVDVALAVLVSCEPVVEVEVGLAEEGVATLVLDGNERAQDRANRLRRDLAVRSLDLLGVLRDVVEHRTQVLEVDEQHLLVIGNAKDDVEHTFLHFSELE